MRIPSDIGQGLAVLPKQIEQVATKVENFRLSQTMTEWAYVVVLTLVCLLIAGFLYLGRLFRRWRLGKVRW
jgi:hypothetical protein